MDAPGLRVVEQNSRARSRRAREKDEKQFRAQLDWQQTSNEGIQTAMTTYTNDYEASTVTAAASPPFTTTPHHHKHTLPQPIASGNGVNEKDQQKLPL